MQLAQIKNQVFTAIATTSTTVVKQWAEAHGLDVDLRTKQSWLAVLTELGKVAAAAIKKVAIAVNDFDMVEANDRICAKAAEVKEAVMPALRCAWTLAKIGFWAIAWIAGQCFMAGRATRQFVSEFEDTGMGPVEIAGFLAKPLLKRAKVQWEVLQEQAIALSAQQRVRESAVGAVGGFILFTGAGLIG